MFNNRVPWGLILKRFAGHSKWANIKHIKATKDAQRSALFTKLSRQIKVAIQEGGSPNPDANLRLSQVIEQAKRNCMPVATIQGVIKATQTNKSDCKSGLIEIRGPAGCVVLCEVFTDNMTRCKQAMATVLKKHGASFSDGGGRHLFEQKGLIEATPNEPIADENKLMDVAMEHAIESGADDVRIGHENTLEFVCEPKQLKPVHSYLESVGYTIQSAAVEYLPKMRIPLDESHLENLSVLFDKLEGQEDVVKLYDNNG